MRKKLLIIALVVVACAVAFSGCNPSKENLPDVKYGDIYTSHNEIRQYSEAVSMWKLPDGLSPYGVTDSKGNTDYTDSYSEYGLFVCKQTVESVTTYGVYSIAKKGLIGDGAVYTEFGIEYGFVLLTTANKECLVFNANGDEIVTAADGYKLDSRVTSISKLFVPISENYIAVRNQNEYYFFLNKNGKEIKKSDGSKWTVNSGYYGSTFGLTAADNYIVRTKYSSTTSSKKVTDVAVYNAFTQEMVYDVFVTSGTYASTNVRAAFYLGNNKLYCYQQTTSTKDDGYQYFLKAEDESNNKYYKMEVWSYDLAKGEKTRITPDIMYMSIINKYNAESVGVDVEQYLNDGYSFADVAYLRRSDKSAETEQAVIDSDLNIYVSAFDRLGTSTIYSNLNWGSRDVKIIYSGDYGVAPESSGNLMLYDKNGNTIFNIEGTFTSAVYNSGVVVAKQTFTSNTSTATTSYYCAYNTKGEPLFDAADRRYSSLTPYIGDYALAIKNKTVIMIDKKGYENSVTDIYTTSSKYFYVNGVYVSYAEANAYGLKNFAGDVLFENDNYNIVIHKYTDTVVFYTTDKNGKWELYFVK